METDPPIPNDAQNLSNKSTIAAYHEAGHIVIAAALGLRLRSEGISLDPEAQGLACYCKQPEASDVSRERVILSTFAGCFAQDRFSQENALPILEYLARIWSLDWREAREIMGSFTDAYFAGRQIDDVIQDFERKSQELVTERWAAIAHVAHALLVKDWEPLKPLKSGGQWSGATTAKYLSGDEVSAILQDFGISSTITADC